MSRKEVKRNRDKKLAKRKIVSKQKSKQRRILKGQNQNLPVLPTERRSYKRIYVAKSDFRFGNNRDEVLSLISRIEKSLHHSESVFIDLVQVKSIDLEAIVLLLGIMAEFNTQGIKFNGSLPLDFVARGKLKDSGFLERLFPQTVNYSFGKKKGIFTHGKNVTDQNLTADIISNSLIAVFGKRKRSQGAQRVLIEAMKNTISHASTSPGRNHWWLSVREDPKEGKVTFSFLDYGVGIFKSLTSRDKSDPGYSWLEKNLKLGYSNHVILEKIMNGELHNVSRTKKQQHGTGLPSMKSAYSNGFISKLTIMSNDVIGDVGNGVYQKIPVNFSGTLIQFEIVDTCKSFDYE